LQKINANLKKSHYAYNKIFESNSTLDQIIQLIKDNNIEEESNFNFSTDINNFEGESMDFDEVIEELDFDYENIEKELDLDEDIEEILNFDDDIREELDFNEDIEETLDFNKDIEEEFEDVI
jgi:hypothetical protein